MTKQLGTGDDTGGPAPGARESAAFMHRPQPSGSDNRGVTVRLPAAEAPAGPDATPPQTDRLRYLDAATRQIARGMNLDETLYELCRAAVPAFADTAFVHLYAPLPIGDDIGAAPEILRLHTVDHASLRAPASTRAPHHPRRARTPSRRPRSSTRPPLDCSPSCSRTDGRCSAATRASPRRRPSCSGGCTCPGRHRPGDG